MQRVIVTLCIISIPFFQSFSKRYSKTNLKIDIPSENIHFRMQVYKGKNYFILPKVASHSLNKYMDNERIWQWEKTYIIGKTNVILDSLKVGDIVGDICTGFYKIRKKTSFRLLYFIPPQKMLILSNFILFLPFCKAIWMYFMPLGLLFLKIFFL